MKNFNINKTHSLHYEDENNIFLHILDLKTSSNNIVKVNEFIFECFWDIIYIGKNFIGKRKYLNQKIVKIKIENIHYNKNLKRFEFVIYFDDEKISNWNCLLDFEFINVTFDNQNETFKTSMTFYNSLERFLQEY